MIVEDDVKEQFECGWTRLAGRLDASMKKVVRINPLRVAGRLVKMNGVVMEAVGCRLDTGQRCQVWNEKGESIEAEVVGFEQKKVFLVPLEYREGFRPGSKVFPIGRDSSIPVGDELVGRVIDGIGRSLDDSGPIECSSSISFLGSTLNPLVRRSVDQPLDVGVRSINGLLTVGKGQRVGLFSPTGTGKSTLLGMMTKNTAADLVVVSLIGERGREVRDFIHRTLGPESMKKAVVIAAPADHSPVMRLRAAHLSHRIAEYFRDTGRDVLLLMDSLTRYAQARREIGLAIGESASSSGYPPSSFTYMSRLVERAGNSLTSSGSLSAFYTVLVEGDAQTDPVAESAKAILDGHIVLSREMANIGAYPAIDILSSISRTMPYTVSADYLKKVERFKQLYEKAAEGRELKLLGVYREGRDPLIDQAMKMEPVLKRYLKQAVGESVGLAESKDALEAELAQVEESVYETLSGKQADSS